MINFYDRLKRLQTFFFWNYFDWDGNYGRACVCVSKPRALQCKCKSLNLFKHPVWGYLPSKTFCRAEGVENEEEKIRWDVEKLPVRNRWLAWRKKTFEIFFFCTH